LSYGDGTPTSPAHSFYHKYAGAGNYLASLQATGPAGTDAASKTVPVKAPANPGLALLLLEG
jgi:PKD repeat protein